MKKDEPDLLGWLGLRRKPDFSKARPLGGLISVSVAAVLAWLLISAIIRFVQASWSIDPDGTALRNTGLVLAAMIGVPFLVWRSVVAQKQVDVAEQGQITDRINKAVEGLGAERTVKTVHETPRYQKKGSKWVRDGGGNLMPALRPDGLPIVDRKVAENSEPNLEVRIGAIYALERIAQDSVRDAISIIKILSAYVRENCAERKIRSAEETSENLSGLLDKVRYLRTDVSAALEVTLKLTASSAQPENLKKAAGFRGSVFRRLMLGSLNFSNCDLRLCDFGGAFLLDNDFEGAVFTGSSFDGSFLTGSNVKGCIFGQTSFDKATDLANSNFQGALFYSCDLSETNITQEQLSLTYGDASVKLSASLHKPRHWSKKHQSFDQLNTAWQRCKKFTGYSPANRGSGA